MECTRTYVASCIFGAHVRYNWPLCLKGTIPNTYDFLSPDLGEPAIRVPGEILVDFDMFVDIVDACRLEFVAQLVSEI